MIYKGFLHRWAGFFLMGLLLLPCLSVAQGKIFRKLDTVSMRTPEGAVRSWPTFDVVFATP